MFVCVLCTCLMRLYVLQCQDPACLRAILFALYIRTHDSIQASDCASCTDITKTDCKDRQENTRSFAWRRP